MGKLENLVGQQFNYLEVIRRDENRHGQCAYWICLCHKCGNEVSVGSTTLKSLRQKTCGCGHPMKDVQGQSRDRLYGIWIKMKHRCYNPKDVHYKNWGARGIRICAEWLENYNNFRDWALANGYEDNLSINRIDNDGNYCPENCEWVTLQEQNKNTSKTVHITIDGITKCKKDWSIELGYNYSPSTKIIINKLKKVYGIDTIIHIKKGDTEYDI